MSTGRRAARRGGAAVVAAGILLSRVAGFARERVAAHFFGVGAHADVFSTAFRGPNVLQVLLGEQTLSAAFIPIYSRLLEEGGEEEAGRFAGAVFGLLLAGAAALSLAGVLLARPIVALFAAGYLRDAARVAAGELTVDRFELAVTAVRVIFPMTGVLVLSAWALGVLNSHRRFFLPYAAPVVWNSAIIAAFLLAGRMLGEGAWRGAAELGAPDLDQILFAACFGALAGGLLQFLVQLPLVARLVRGFRLSASSRAPHVKEALRAFGPALAGRGVVQLSLYLDHYLASFLAVGAVGTIRWASFLYALPVSLFGMSVAAAELPELARLGSGESEEKRAALGARARRSLAQMAFLTVPTAVGYLAFGFLLVGALYRSGGFSLAANWLVYLVLAAYTLGLPASTSSRLLQNAFYALGDTRTPARVAFVRVLVSAAVGAALMLWLDRYPVSALVAGLGNAAGTGEGKLYLGALGLAVGSVAGAWLELWRLRRALAGRLGDFALPWREAAPMFALALAAALPAALLAGLLPPLHVAVRALLVVGAYAALYLAAARALRLSQMEAWVGRLRRRG